MSKLNLIEILHDQMDILFVALNPPVNSNNNGHYFSNNLSFWNLMCSSGLIIQPVQSKLTGDDEVFRTNFINYKKAVYGITDLVHDVVETNSNKIVVDRSRVNRIIKLLDTHHVKTLCLMHSKVANAFQDIGVIKRLPNYGIVGKYKSTIIYEVPFHNASIANKEQYYGLLKHTLH
ncbi:hypothetical protein [Phnomibacter ginsenosidimutans]|uniref:Uracil-DNA glycosylase-like domain-containing protein n=1 Tax=Phnomibacter ginsenosidimutans TaxID=2676868 RepID=A0A6I6GP71_9BACT|nr:hypothetical protein [Phnomibacter ginsenosidimutans]QGW28732.1 hypothetical protein GLV81_12050 [Phnomibacter ginsenosidimutans]